MANRMDSLAVQIPDGRTATFEIMRDYGRAAQQFVRDTEAALAEVADAGQHNRIVDYLHVVADAYNDQLRIFRASEQERQLRVAAFLVALAVDDNRYGLGREPESLD